MSRRCGSAIALNASDVVAARAMASSYAHIGMRQGIKRVLSDDDCNPCQRLRETRIAELAQAMARLDRGEPLDDRLLAQYAVAGTAEECLAQCRGYAKAGVTELALAPIGERGVEDIARLGRTL